jgi:exodeoxyribonuclease V alpha subunit
MPLGYLPEHETAFALTVHKSQGSEYDSVLVVLPDEKSELLSRELLYTAVTRARAAVAISAGRHAIEAACVRSVQRRSGLAEALRAALDAAARRPPEGGER